MMTRSTGQEIVIQISTIEQIFNPPDVNPFSERETDVLGEAALNRAVRQLQARGWRHKKGTRLLIQLPADQITPGLQLQVQAAVRRYCAAKIEDNLLQIQLSRRQSLVGLVMVTLILVVIGAIGYLLFASILANASEIIQGVFVGIMCVFTWVILWDPMEKLLFDWVAPSLENRTLRGIMDLDTVVESQS
jgi:chitinase